MTQRNGCLLLVATTGGHLVELVDLADRLPGFETRLWVTFDSLQAQTLLARERVSFLPEIGERDVVGVFRALPSVHRIVSQERQVAAVVSTGSAIALPFLPYCVARGIAAHYIESSARTGKPSLTGRLLATVPGIHLYKQYEQMLDGRWQFGGSVFDGYECFGIAPRPIRRIVVTLGTMKQSFRQLLERLIMVIPRDVSVLWQTGATPTNGLGIVAKALLPPTELAQAMREADAVVSHSACGSALTALKVGKWPVLVPRNPRAGEVVDAHQQELAVWLGSRGLALSRMPGELTFQDLEHAAQQCVVRTSSLPDFRLAGSLSEEADPGPLQTTAGT